MAVRVPNSRNAQLMKTPFISPYRRGLSAPFSVIITGASQDSLGFYAQIGNHSAIGYTITPEADPRTDTAKWSNSSNPADAATFGTGASPTDFAALSTPGDRIYLHVTDDPDDNPDLGPVTVTRSFLVRFAPGVAPSVPDQEPWEVGAAIAPIDISASGANLTFTYSVTGQPIGVSINPDTVRLEGTPTAPAPGPITVTATDQYDRTYTTTFAASAAIPSSQETFALTEGQILQVGSPVIPPSGFNLQGGQIIQEAV